MGRSDSLRTVSPRLVCASLGDTTPCVCVRLSVPARRQPGGQGLCGMAIPTPCLVEAESQGVPSSWGVLVCLCRVLRPRRDRTHQAVAVCRRGPRSAKTEGSPRVGLSGLSSTAWALAVYASQGGLPHRHARLASGCGPGSTGWDWLPTGLLRKVSAMYSLHPSSFPKFAWRNGANRCLVRTVVSLTPFRPPFSAPFFGPKRRHPPEPPDLQELQSVGGFVGHGACRPADRSGFLHRACRPVTMGHLRSPRQVAKGRALARAGWAREGVA